MRNNEKETAHTNQNAKRSRETNVSYVQTDYTPKKSDLQEDILLSLIGHGSDNGVHLADLVRLTGLDSRIVRKRIETLRRSGHVICADESGYYFPSTYAELSHYVRRTEKQARSIFLTLRSARRRLAELSSDGDENSAGGV